MNDESDAMAAEWAAALSEAKPAADAGGMRSARCRPRRWRPPTFTNFAPTDGMTGAGNDHQHDPRHPGPADRGARPPRASRSSTSCSSRRARSSSSTTLAGEPMDVLVNGFLIAQGGGRGRQRQVHGIRLTDIVTPRRAHAPPQPHVSGFGIKSALGMPTPASTSGHAPAGSLATLERPAGARAHSRTLACPPDDRDFADAPAGLRPGDRADPGSRCG